MLLFAPSGISDISEAMAVCMLSQMCTPGPSLKESDSTPLTSGNTSDAVSPLPMGIPPEMVGKVKCLLWIM